MRVLPIRLLVFISLILIPFQNVTAAPHADVQNDQVTFAFPNTATFSATLNSTAKITSVVLEYGTEQQTCGEVIAKAFPQFTSSKTVNAQWVWDMRQSGSLPPGADIWWRWHYTDSSGADFVSDKQNAIWLDDAHAWKTVSSGNLNIHYYGKDNDFAQTMLDAGLEGLRRNKEQAGLINEDEMNVYVYPNYQDMQDAVLYEPSWTGGQAYSDFNIVILGLSNSDATWDKNTVIHELTHLLVGHFTFSCIGTLPGWIEEGLAMFSEGQLDSGMQSSLDEAVKNNSLITLRSLNGGFSELPDKANLSYSQSYSVIKFMIDTYGQQKMTDLLIALRDAKPIDEALTEVYGFDTNGLDSAWRESVGAAPLTVSTQATAQPTPTYVPTYVPVSGNPLAITPTPLIVPTSSFTNAPQASGPPLALTILLACLCLAILAVFGVLILGFVARRGNAKGDQMLNKKIVATLTAFAFLFSILFTYSTRNVSALQSIPEDQALVYSGGESSNLREYDPATTHSSGDKLAFSGLVSLDPHLNVTPGIAENWDISDDGTIYTFHIRENAKFHDGRAVKASDFVYAWERAASPKIGSDTASTYLGDILGVKEMLAGQADHISGLKVIDDLTLQVTIDAPKPYFIMKLTYPTAFVLDKANVDSGEEWVHQPNGTGPYQLTEWKSGEYILYSANPDFYLGVPSIPYVIVKLFAGQSVRLYETNEVDVAGVGIYDADRFLDPAEPLHSELQTGVALCTDYVTFDTTKPPFDDVNVRKAFSMAFDRQRYIDVVLRGHALPAVGIYPPGLPGFSYDLKGLPYDPAQARELLKQSKCGGPEGLPPIVYTDSGIGNYVGLDVSAMAEMWQQNLGVTITVENIEYDHFYDQIFSGNHGQLVRGGWCADYPDPENFADVLFHSGSDMNRGGYSNLQLDALLEKARIERDVTARMNMYHQAEQMIVDDAPVLFTTHSLSYELVKPYVKGYVFTPISVPLERYLWIDGK